MKINALLFSLFALSLLGLHSCNKSGQSSLSLGRYGQVQKLMLPNGWSLTPVGEQLELGDLPMNMVLSKSNY